MNGVGSFRDGQMIIANDARNLPLTIFESPDGHEFRFANTLLFVSRMLKSMYSSLNRTILVQPIDLKRTGNQHPLCFSANVVFDTVYKDLPSD